MVIEFAGQPRSGKSTAIGVTRAYFRRAGYPTSLQGEAAAFCPIDRSHRVEFACWVANQAVNTTLKSGLVAPRDMMTFVDRGLFDALAFLKLLEMERLVTRDELNEFLHYFAKRSWTRFVSIVFLFRVEAEIAVQRDIARQLGARPGLINNSNTQANLAEAYEFVLNDYRSRFDSVHVIDTTSIDVAETARRVISVIQMSPELQRG
jgi:predicted ATPase